MSREILGGEPALGPGMFPVLALARLLPERSVLELRDAIGAVGSPTRQVFLHLAAPCEPCTRAALLSEGDGCRRGARLLERAHGWRSRAPEGLTNRGATTPGARTDSPEDTPRET